MVGVAKTVMVGLAGTEPLVFWLEGRIAQSAQIGWPTACHRCTNRSLGAAATIVTWS